MREVILNEIRRLAALNGKAPGARLFVTETGIGQHEWYGRYWARWTDAVKEAGLEGNSLQGRFDSAEVMRKVVEAFREQGYIPTTPEMKIRRANDPSFPNPKTVASHFGSRADLIQAVRSFCETTVEFRDLLPLLPDVSAKVISKVAAPSKVDEGWVYLIKSGAHYKIGRSDELERRIKEIRVALPEAASMVHAIRTDDPSGIEAYWHRRFADRRANGEWFALRPADVVAFKRRRFQ